MAEHDVKGCLGIGSSPAWFEDSYLSHIGYFHQHEPEFLAVFLTDHRHRTRKPRPLAGSQLFLKSPSALFLQPIPYSHDLEFVESAALGQAVVEAMLQRLGSQHGRAALPPSHLKFAGNAHIDH